MGFAKSSSDTALEQILDEKRMSVMRSAAEHYFHDALDFAARFDLLWEVQTHKTGRIKSFVDLLMSAECILKAHTFLGNESEDPKNIYTRVLKASHRIRELAEIANYLQDRTAYDVIGTQLGEFPVVIRYSLDAYDTFFPAFRDRENAKANHEKTIGNHSWVMTVRNSVAVLIDSINVEFTGFVAADIEAILENELQMREFMDSRRK